MKLILPAAALLALAACTSKPTDGFVINGTVAGGADGESVAISYYVADSVIKDTVLIKDGKFSFEGTVPAYGAMGYISYGEPSEPYRGDNAITVYFDRGETNVAIEKGKVPEGTVTGSRMQEMENEYKSLINTIQEQRFNLTRDTPRYDEIQDSLLNEFRNAQITTTKKYADSFWAYHLFAIVKDYFSIEDCDYIYERMNPEIKALAGGVKIKESIEARRKLMPGMPAPILKGEDPLREKIVSLEDLKGKYVLIDFWATWCKGCVLALPHIREVYDKYHDKGLEVMCVTSDYAKDKWVDYMREHDMGVYYNIPGVITEDCKFGGEDDFVQTKLYNISAIPQTYLIDPEGKIVAHLDGEKDIDAKLAEIFK